MRRLLLIILGAAAILTACQPERIYSEFHSISTDGWHKDSVLRYEINIVDSISKFDVLITLRHNAQYPYQNMWMFVNEWYGGLLLQRDTIECDLADSYGRWLGNGASIYELPLLYTSSYQFARTGEYLFTIQHGMRTEWLQGITDIGLIIEECNGKK